MVYPKSPLQVFIKISSPLLHGFVILQQHRKFHRDNPILSNCGMAVPNIIQTLELLHCLPGVVQPLGLKPGLNLKWPLEHVIHACLEDPRNGCYAIPSCHSSKATRFVLYVLSTALSEVFPNCRKQWMPR